MNPLHLIRQFPRHLPRPAIASLAMMVLLVFAVWLLPTPSSKANDKAANDKAANDKATNDKVAANKPASTAKAALTVSTARPQLTRLSQTLAANGDIAAWQERFSDETVQADLAQTNAALLEAQATLAEASSNAERARSLVNTGAISTQQINQFLTAEQTARARVAGAEANVSAQKLRLKFTQLLAPDSGVISSRSATVGAVVANGTELFRMIRKGRLEWRAEVMASELSRIRVGSGVTLVAANGTRLNGKVRMIGPTVNPQNRSALVYVDLLSGASGEAAAKPGMYARGEFTLGSGNGVTLPQQAVVVRDGFSYVFQIKPDGRVAQLKVKTGRYLQDQVEITEGISLQDEIVVAGAGFLNDGDLVRVTRSNAVARDSKRDTKDAQ
ncbi:MAG: efflux RND transporter periplasmic adaptor subunit [Burkholderiales bacterium]|nr:efflux RND transporter periplasmic adaptor subunit [Burkholderiales bacterium]